MNQLEFNLEPSPIVVVDPNVEAEAKPRLTRQAWAVLQRLQQGPATNVELIAIAQRFGARIHDLRKAGYEIERTSVDVAAGVYGYELKDSNA